MWKQRFDGVAPGGRLGRALKPMVDKHGWPAVKAAWAAYLTEYDPDFARTKRTLDLSGGCW